jgi:hypothetical protein
MMDPFLLSQSQLRSQVLMYVSLLWPTLAGLALFEDVVRTGEIAPLHQVLGLEMSMQWPLQLLFTDECLDRCGCALTLSSHAQIQRSFPYVCPDSACAV